MWARQVVVTAVKGMFIGVANIIPGVSGGTFALLLGVFDRIVLALNRIDASTVGALVRGALQPWKPAARARMVAELRRIDAAFLAVLGGGAAAAAVGLAFAMEYLLAVHTAATLAFFIGLIIPSVAVPLGMMHRKDWRLLWAVPGMALTAGLAFAMPASAASDNLLFCFVAAVVAVSAMILPGISGSFVLLVLGQYQVFLSKTTAFLGGLAAGEFPLDAFVWLAVFAVGLAVGLLAFARFLAWLLRRAHDATMAFLVGLILGSLFVLWPFKDVNAGARVVDRHGEVKQDVQIATARNRMPRDWGEGGLAAAALAAGMVGSWGVAALGRRKEEGDIDPQNSEHGGA